MKFRINKTTNKIQLYYIDERLIYSIPITKSTQKCIVVACYRKNIETKLFKIPFDCPRYYYVTSTCF